MAIAFKGASGMTLQGGETISEAPDGSKTAQRVFSGDVSEVASILSTWPRGKEHPDEPGVYVDGRIITKHGDSIGPAEVAISFSGRPGAQNSSGGATVVGRGLTVRSVTLQQNNRDFVVTYLAPVATVGWVSSADVTWPTQDGLSGVSSIDPVFVDINPVLGQPSSAFTKGTEYELVVIPSGFRTQQIGSTESAQERWQVQETWTRVIEPKT